MRKLLLLVCILSITISAKAQLFGKRYDEGSYTDLNGVKHTGLISWSTFRADGLGGAADKFSFKPKKEAKEVKIKSTEIQSFFIRADSFVVSKNEDLVYDGHPFLKVSLNNNDSLKLYCLFTLKGTAPSFTMGPQLPTIKETYYFGANPDKVTKLNKKNFKEAMIKLMGDKPDVVESIKSEKMRLKDMDDLLIIYSKGITKPTEIAVKADTTTADN